MSKLPYTRKEQEVWQACDDLLAKGVTVKEITGEAIAVRLRELRYKVGSTTQRYQYRDSWMAARGLSREEQGRSVADITDPIARAAAVFREGLERELRLEFEKKYQQLQAALDDKEAVLQLREGQLQACQQQLNELEQTHQDLQNRYAIQTQDWQSLKQDNIIYQALNVQLKQQAEKAENMAHQQAQYFKQALEKYRQEQQTQLIHTEKIYTAHISDMKEAAENQRHRMMMEVEESKTVAKRNQQDLIKWQENYMVLKQQQQGLQAAHQEVTSQLQQLQAEKEANFQNLIQTLSEQNHQCQQLLASHEAQARLLNNLPSWEQALVAIQNQLDYLLPLREKEAADVKY